jgi:hypothetical protein
MAGEKADFIEVWKACDLQQASSDVIALLANFLVTTTDRVGENGKQ